MSAKSASSCVRSSRFSACSSFRSAFACFCRAIASSSFARASAAASRPSPSPFSPPPPPPPKCESRTNSRELKKFSGPSSSSSPKSPSEPSASPSATPRCVRPPIIDDDGASSASASAKRESRICRCRSRWKRWMSLSSGAMSSSASPKRPSAKTLARSFCWCSTSSVSRRIWSERARACSVVRRLCVNFLPSTLCLRRSVCRDSKAEGRPADARTASLTRPPALGIAVWCAALATESTTTTRSRAKLTARHACAVIVKNHRRAASSPARAGQRGRLPNYRHRDRTHA